MIKQIIKIDDSKCVGCGLCVNACQQDALILVNGKAKLMHENYCDGLGNCLPVCPTDAISFIKKDITAPPREKSSCPSKVSSSIKREESENIIDVPSELSQWPCQIKLVSSTAPFFENAELLIAADCTAFAYGNIHKNFIKGKTTIIGCPKLDSTDYSIKIQEIINNNNIKSITILRMIVPCCAGIDNMVRTAISNSNKNIPTETIVISTKGEIVE